MVSFEREIFTTTIYNFAGALQGASAVSIPSSYITKYNKYVDSIFSRINKILKKNYDPVNVRLQTAPEQKKKPTASKTSTKQKKRPSAKPSSRTDQYGLVINF